MGRIEGMGGGVPVLPCLNLTGWLRPRELTVTDFLKGNRGVLGAPERGRLGDLTADGLAIEILSNLGGWLDNKRVQRATEVVKTWVSHGLTEKDIVVKAKREAQLIWAFSYAPVDDIIGEGNGVKTASISEQQLRRLRAEECFGRGVFSPNQIFSSLLALGQSGGEKLGEARARETAKRLAWTWMSCTIRKNTAHFYEDEWRAKQEAVLSLFASLAQAGIQARTYLGAGLLGETPRKLFNAIDSSILFAALGEKMMAKMAAEGIMGRDNWEQLLMAQLDDLGLDEGSANVWQGIRERFFDSSAWRQIYFHAKARLGGVELGANPRAVNEISLIALEGPGKAAAGSGEVADRSPEVEWGNIARTVMTWMVGTNDNPCFHTGPLSLINTLTDSFPIILRDPKFQEQAILYLAFTHPDNNHNLAAGIAKLRKTLKPVVREK